jgi:hypothetical protein
MSEEPLERDEILDERTPEDAETILSASLKLAEAYCAWVFEPRTSHRLGVLGDAIQTAFRNYLAAAHPAEFRVMKLAEKGFALPRVVID